MTSVSNTQAFLFTSIPRSITRTWIPEVISATNRTKLPYRSLIHEESIIQQIELKVEFHDLLSDIPSELGTDTDHDDSRIEVWQEARHDWASLEAAINEEISGFLNRAIKRATKRQIKTVDSLTKTSIKYLTGVENGNNNEYEPQSSGNSSPNDKRVETIIDYPESSSATIRPQDSISIADHQSIQELVASVLQSEQNTRRHQNRPRNPLLRYVAESGKHARMRR